MITLSNTNRFSVDALLNIFRYVDFEDALASMQVCKTFYRVFTNPKLALETDLSEQFKKSLLLSGVKEKIVSNAAKMIVNSLTDKQRSRLRHQGFLETYFPLLMPQAIRKQTTRGLKDFEYLKKSKFFKEKKRWKNIESELEKYKKIIIENTLSKNNLEAHPILALTQKIEETPDGNYFNPWRDITHLTYYFLSGVLSLALLIFSIVSSTQAIASAQLIRDGFNMAKNRLATSFAKPFSLGPGKDIIDYWPFSDLCSDPGYSATDTYAFSCQDVLSHNILAYKQCIKGITQLCDAHMGTWALAAAVSSLIFFIALPLAIYFLDRRKKQINDTQSYKNYPAIFLLPEHSWQLEILDIGITKNKNLMDLKDISIEEVVSQLKTAYLKLPISANNLYHECLRLISLVNQVLQSSSLSYEVKGGNFSKKQLIQKVVIFKSNLTLWQEKREQPSSNSRTESADSSESDIEISYEEDKFLIPGTVRRSV